MRGIDCNEQHANSMLLGVSESNYNLELYGDDPPGNSVHLGSTGKFITACGEEF